MASSNRKTSFVSITTYVTPEQVGKILADKSEQLEHGFYILHDKDQAEPHVHVVLKLKAKRYLKDIIAWFKAGTDFKGELANTRIQDTHDCGSMVEYLTHEKEPTKHQYTRYDIRVSVGSLDEYATLETDEQKAIAKAEDAIIAREAHADDIEQELQDIIDGVPMRSLARKYGRDYIKNRKAYHEYAAMMVVEEEGDLDKADKIMGIGFDQLRYEAHKEGYTEGVRESFRSVTRMIEKRVAAGNTFDKDLLALLGEITKNI